jgi:hypothetical protein
MFQGICPECNSEDLNYNPKPNFPDAETLEYGWKCFMCNAEGLEVYSLHFVEHIVTEKGTTNGNV